MFFLDDGHVVLEPEKDIEVDWFRGSVLHHPHILPLRLPRWPETVPDEFRYLAALIDRVELRWEEEHRVGEVEMRLAYSMDDRAFVQVGRCWCGQGFWRWRTDRKSRQSGQSGQSGSAGPKGSDAV